jgi:membrane-bound lytic murein transglycosylase D
MKRLALLPLLLWACLGQAEIPGSLQFKVDNRLRPNVDFWVKIYSQYTSEEGLLHDARYVDRVYEVIDVSRSGSGARIRAAKQRWRAALLSLHRKWIKSPEGTPPGMSADEAKVFELFKDVREPDKFFNAAHRKRLRFQLGQKDRFLEGYRQAGRFLPMMEEVFKRENMPLELTRLPFVESSFNVKARSKVGASGIWQFMRSTAKLYIAVDDSLDERNDPIRATEAAAKLLKANYESLRAWPLAVTAYNHGRKGLMRAVRRVGSDQLEDVVADYRSRTFGFASSNFFVELLAAVEVEKNAEKYFGRVEREKPVEFVQVRMPDYVPYRELCRFLKLDPRRLRELNPGLTDAVFTGARWIPAGFGLRLPASPNPGDGEKGMVAKLFLAGYEELPSVYKRRGQRLSSYGTAD